MSQRILTDESPETPAGASATRGERTLELAVLYGHSPQRVLHLEPPTSGRPRFFSLLMFALGFALLVAGASSFGYQLLRVHRETLHRAKVVEFVKERGLPEKYAPQVTTRPGAEAASAAAFAAGLFLFLFGGLRLREELRRPGFRVGEDPRADYSVPSAALPSSCFELVSADDEGYRVHLTTSMEGEATLPEGDRVALADLRKRGLATLDQGERSHAWLLPEDGRCRIELGATTFLLHATRTNLDLLPSPVSKRALAALGSPLALSTLGSATVLVAFLALLQWRPGTTDSLESDSVDSTRQRLVRELQASAPKEKVAPRPKAPREPARPVKVALHSKNRKTASQTPRPIDERISGPAQDAAGHSGPGASASRHRGLNTGMVAVLRASSQQLANMFSRQAAMTKDAEDSLAAITGYTYGSGDPLAGLGDGGRGGHTPGAGGASPCGAFCSFGKEPFGGFPRGGTVGGVPIGPGVPNHRPRDPQVFGPSRAEVLEGIDGDTIQRVIRRYLNQIRYCYQAVGLPNNPRLQGEIKVAFLIGPMGTVLRTEMVSSSLGNGPTEQCVLAQIRTWRFPKTGGRTAYVVYPFRFRPSGAR